MKRDDKSVNRRQFLKAAGAAGLGSIVGAKVFAEPNDPNVKQQQPNQPTELPKQKLGKTGVEIPCLALGVAFNAMDNQLILRKAIDWGVTCWDTSHFYENGNSELGIGKFLQKNPDERKKLFIVSKASFARTAEDVEKRLQTSLERMKTDYIDLYYGVHGLSNPTQLNDEMKHWVESTKERKLIKFFGFSTHSNMANCLLAASKLGWIDAVTTSFNFRLMQDQKLIDAVQACYDAEVGVIAMKTQAKEIEMKEADKKLTEHFLERGFTEGQAKIKLVLDDERIAAACVGRDNIQHLHQNVAAVLDKTELTQLDKEVFKSYAAATCSGYCAGCGYICDSAVEDVSCVSDVMRYLMYYNSFGDTQTARQLYVKIPQQVRDRLLTTDYSVAEARCPQGLPIGRLMAQAVDKLA
ncbi:MAG: aldo/keto reductase [Planctomycetota bacterium]